MPPGFRPKSFTIDYTHDVIIGEPVFRPRISTRMQNGDKSFRTGMLIDSGADMTFIPLVVAEILELELSNETYTSHGASGPFQTKKSEMELWLAPGGKEEYPLGSIPVIVPVKKISDDAGVEISYCLLGRNPLFIEYDITFQESQRRVSFRPASKPFERPKSKN